MTTLTRADAHDLVNEADEAGSLNKLISHWSADAGSDADALHEFVNAAADMNGGDDQRSQGPRDDDDTGLDAPGD